MTFNNEAKNPFEAWRNITQFFLSTNKDLIRDEKYVTYNGVIVSTIEKPTTIVGKNHKFSQDYGDAYVKQVVEGSENDFIYTYHKRLFDYDSINQIEYIVDELNRDKKSRRAVAITWQPKIDEKLEDVPCLQFVKCLNQNGALDMTVMFRSHDMFLGFYMNVIGLSGLMQSIADKLNLNVGKLTVISLSAHVYIKRDSDDMRKLLNNYWNG